MACGTCSSEFAVYIWTLLSPLPRLPQNKNTASILGAALCLQTISSVHMHRTELHFSTPHLIPECKMLPVLGWLALSCRKHTVGEGPQMVLHCLCTTGIYFLDSQHLWTWLLPRCSDVFLYVPHSVVPFSVPPYFLL